MNKESLAKERRKHERLALSLPYTLEIDGKSYSGITGNVSLGGLYAETISPPIKDKMTGKEGVLTLQLDTEYIVANCRIVYIGGMAIPHLKGVGISFLNPEEKRLVEVLQKLFLKKSDSARI